MNESTRKVIREWLEKDGGDIEPAAQWMSRSVRAGGLRECRRLILEAIEDELRVEYTRAQCSDLRFTRLYHNGRTIAVVHGWPTKSEVMAKAARGRSLRAVGDVLDDNYVADAIPPRAVTG